MDQRRQRLYRTPAIILKRQDFSEADRILTLFTPGLGKLRAIAKGVRKITSRKSGHVELFTYSNLLIAKGRNLDIVTQAETIKAFRAIREDLGRITYAYYVAELVDKFTEDRDENQPLFDLLLTTLQSLTETDDLRLAVRFFELRLLDYTGYRPQLFRCVQCNEKVEPVENFFGFELGGILCPDCITALPDRPAIRERRPGYAEGSSMVEPISVNALKLLRFMQREAYPTVRRVNVRHRTHTEMEQLMHHYLTYMLERSLKSVEFLGALTDRYGMI